MRGGNEGIDGYEGTAPAADPAVCKATGAQIGWRDSDGDGTPNVLDTTPTVALKPPSSDGSSANVTGSVHENPWPHGFKANTTDGTHQDQAFTHDISVLVPHDVQYRVDGGDTWSPVDAVDGSFDEPSESITLTTPALGPGPDAAAPTRHVIEVRATTGNAATASMVAWVGATPVTLALSRSSSTMTLGGSVKMTVHSLGGPYPIAWLPGIGFGAAGGTTKTIATGADGRWRGSVSPRFTTSYVATFATNGQFQGPAASAQVRVAVHPVLTVRVATTAVPRMVRVTGHFAPVRAGVPLLLQRLRSGVWATVKTFKTDAASNFATTWRASRVGLITLRVRFAGDARNLAAAKAAPALRLK